MQLFPNPLIIPVGLVIGVLIAAPVGPVNVLCIQRAVSRGVFGGIAAGLGAVLGDGLIALMAALGVGAIAGVVEHHQYKIQALGGVALILFGLKLYRTKPYIESTPPSEQRRESLRDFIWDVPQTFFLTITNPGAVLGLVAIFGGVSTFVEVRSTIDALTMVAAIMAGSFGWWVLLSSLIGRIRHRLDLRRLRQINQVAGILLSGFGILLIGELVLQGLPWAATTP